MRYLNGVMIVPCRAAGLTDLGLMGLLGVKNLRRVLLRG